MNRMGVGQDQMIIREGENFLEIPHTDTSPPATPTPGDVRLSVCVSSDGFTGTSSHVWVDAASFSQFVGKLQALEAHRRGTARLEAMSSPDEFWFELRAIDRAGHMAAFGRLCRWQFLSAGEGYHQAVEFGLEFCPSLLPGVVAAFHAMSPGSERGAGHPHQPD